jgi:hypothetical protein
MQRYSSPVNCNPQLPYLLLQNVYTVIQPRFTEIDNIISFRIYAQRSHGHVDLARYQLPHQPCPLSIGLFCPILAIAGQMDLVREFCVIIISQMFQ